MSKTFGKIFGSSSKESSSSSTPTGFQSLPAWAQQGFQSNFTNAQNLNPSIFAPAPLTAEQNQAIDYFKAPADQLTPERFGNMLSIFSNPFEEQVLNNTIRDLTESSRGGWSDIGAFASDIGGYGSNRRGLLEAELQKNLLRTIGDVSATSRASNFETASQRAIDRIGQEESNAFNKAQSLFDIGGIIQNQNTQAQQAELLKQQFLASLLQGIPTGGGQTSSSTATGADPGMLARLSAGANAFGNITDIGKSIIKPTL